jgi:SAM-dependent methyltransferase
MTPMPGVNPANATFGAPRVPSLELQKGFWNEWNRDCRFGDLDPFMKRQREAALTIAQRIQLRDARILDVGCGTGWLGNVLLPFGQVWGMDLSEAAVAEGRCRHPGVQFLLGDFLTVDPPGPFDFVSSADAINNMYDPAAFVERIGALLRPGGTFLLMTPNLAVWRRRSALKPLGQGQVQYWLSLDEYLTLLQPFFTIERVSTMYPGGDTGLLWWVENRYVRGGMTRLVGRRRWQSLLESMRLGQELVLVCRRRDPAARDQAGRSK